MNEPPLSDLDSWLMRWMARSPDKIKPAYEFPAGSVTVLTQQPALKTSGKRTYMVFAPNIASYVNIKRGEWYLGDWKTVNVGEFVEPHDPLSGVHLIIGVIEHLKALHLYDAKAGLPPCAGPHEAHAIAKQWLIKLVEALESH